MAEGAGGKEVGRISIRVVPNLEGFYRKLKSEIEKIEDSLKAKIKVEPDMGNFRQEVAAKTKGMTAKVKVKPDVDRSFFGRITDKLSKMEGPNFGSGINPAGYATIFAGILAVAAPLVGLLTSALLALPGILAAVLVPIGAIMASLGGLREATKGITQQFIDLSESMTAPVQAQFQKVFDQLGTILPQLKDPLLTVTGGLADMLAGFTDVVTAGPGLAKVQGIISNIGATLSAMKPGISSFTDGLLTLVEKFTSKLPNFAEWFNKAGEDFKNWINKLNQDGTLDKAFEGLGSTLKTLAEGIGRILEKGLDFMKDPKKIEDFNNGLANIANSLTKIVELSDKLNNGNLFSSIFPPGLQLDGGFDFGPLLKDLKLFLGGEHGGSIMPKFDLEGIKKDLLTPFTSEDAGWRGMWDGIKNAASATLSWIKTTWGQLTAWFAQLGGQISSIWTSVWSAISGAATSVWNTITTGVTTVVQAITNAFTSIPALLSGIWGSITSAISGAWQSIVSAVSSGAQQVLSALSGSWSALPGLAAAAFGALVSTVTSVMSQALSAVTSGAAQIVSEIAALGGKIAAAAGNMGSALVGAGKALMDGLLSGIRAGLQAVLSFASGIAAKIAAVKGPLPKDRKELIPAGEALMDGLGTGLENGLNPVLDQAKSIAKQIFEAFKETFGTAPQGLSFNLGQVQSGMQGVVDTSKDLNKAFAPTADLAKGSSLVDPNTTSELNLLKKQLADLELQRKRLAVQKDQAGSPDEKKNIQGEIDRVNEQKRLLDLRKAELGTLQDQTGEMGKQDDLMGGMLSKTVDSVAAFGRSNMDQAFSDLGIGGGALTAALDQGLDWGTKALSNLAGNSFTFNVSNVDDAIAVKNNQLNKQALQYNRA